MDWNEIRVSTVQEVADALRPLPNAGLRAGWIIGVLHAVFEMNYSYDLGDMEKKGLKQAAKQVSRYFNEKDLKSLGLKQAAKQIARFKQVNDFAVAWVVQRSLGGHAIPLDGPTCRVLRRLGVIEEADADDMESVRGGIEHVIPKARGPEFDRHFLTYMIQHHRGAVSMVKELFTAYGAAQDETVFKFANDVEVDQTTEITRMFQMLLTIGAP